MLKLITGSIKFAIFAVIILVLGNWIHWSGSTLSDHIKTHMSQVERHSPSELSKIHESRIESKKILNAVRARPTETHSREQMTSQDQAQFRALLKDLTTHSKSSKQARQ
jgi:hypothetical protein